MKFKQRLLYLVTALGGATGLAHADIYGFVDEQGTTHFSNLRQDSRYSLFLRTPAPESQTAKAGSARARSTASAAKPGSQIRARQQAYSAHVANLASSLSLDPALLHAVITAESGYNPTARSGKGAMGLMQLMPETAQRYSVRNPYDPLENLRGGALYLRDLLRRYKNDIQLALAAYNAGEGAVAKHGNRIPPYAETQDYVPKVLGLYDYYRKAKGLLQISAYAG